MPRLPLALLCWIVLAPAVSARAQETVQLTLPDLADEVSATADASPGAQSSATPRPVAVEYSDAYYTRAKIHKYASFATLPLFATELALGQSIYNDPNARTSASRNAHIAVGTAITGLFAVNTVTGLWNLWESRTD